MNRRVLLAAYPVGMPRLEDFAIEETPIPTPEEGEVLVRNVFFSVDPYMRGRMRPSGTSYAGGFRIGEPMTGGAVGTVIESNRPEWPVGTCVRSMQGWREYFVSDGRDLEIVDPKAAPLSAYLGVLGMPGFTAWYGLTEIGRPQRGETLVVSAAAGAVGSLVGQIGRIRGCRVVGTTGSDEKCAYLMEELRFDAAINYKATDDLTGALRAACPDGIDIYFENVGGRLLEAVLNLVNLGARIPVCGMISQYNREEPEPGPRNLMTLIGRRVRMQGFLISDHIGRRATFERQVSGWIREGRVRYRETIVDGIEHAAEAFLQLFTGGNIGKMLVRVGPDPD